jgi:poly-gamma-glutamate synthesis protein (capsule biosynthesis protein)
MNRKTRKITFTIITILIFAGAGIFFAVKGFNTPHIIEPASDIKKADASVDNSKDKGKDKKGNEKVEIPTEPPIPDSEVNLKMVGDDLLHLSLINAHKQMDGTYDFQNIFDDVRKDIKSADIAIINQETLLGGTEMGLSGYPMFNSPQEAGDDIVEAGFDVVLHSTNHALDKGKQGILNTLHFWKEKHPEIVVCGINESEEEQSEIRTLEKNGIKFAFLNFTDNLNGLRLPSDAPYAVNTMMTGDEKTVKKAIRKAKEQADVVVMCPHWGTEYTYEANSNQKYWTNIFYKEGVDIVIGTHPHVIQPVEWITSDDSDHKMLIYYSLGNFTSGQIYKYAMVGAMADITIKRTNGKIEITKATAIPLVTHYNSSLGDYCTYKLSNYSDKLARQHYISGLTYAYCENLAKDVLGDFMAE